MVSILAVVICLIMTALLFFAVNPTFLIILSNCVGIVCTSGLMTSLPVGASSNTKGDPSSIHTITASFLEHCGMNGFGMTYCFGSKGRKEETAVCNWEIQSSYFKMQTAVSSFLITLPKNDVILNSSFPIIIQNTRIRKG